MAKQLTTAAHGHILTNTAVWSPDGQWIVYDVRSDVEGTVFDGERIERVNVETGEVQVLYQARYGAKCGVATYHPKQDQVVFILGPEHPTVEWNYAPNRRQGVIVDAYRPGHAAPLDARDLVPPFTPGALRGGTHIHVFDGAGEWVSFTYNDQLVDAEQRNVGVSVPDLPVRVPPSHPRNHDGTHFSVLVTRTTANPRPGSDEIARAFDDAWVGANGYLRPDGSRQRRAIAFFGVVIAPDGRPVTELFIADLPEDVTIPGEGPLAGTPTDLPSPPRGTVQRRLTTATILPAIGGRTRQWPRSSSDGSAIAFLMHDADKGVQQIWTISPNGGAPRQLTHNRQDITSAFAWSPDGGRIAHTMDNSVCVTDVATGVTTRLTPRSATAPRPEACVFSPDGSKIAFIRTIDGFNQIFTVPAPSTGY
jgi:dipeptidyl aminopeptidase/acylaminoacyl peptidase